MAGHEASRTWVRGQVEEQDVSRLSGVLGVSPRAARLLVARGITDEAQADRFLNPKLADLPDPFLMKGIEAGARRLFKAIVRGEKIALYGDYDVDGVTSSTLLSAFLRGHGVVPRVYIPKRLTEGYGLNGDAVESLADEGTEVLVTLDCGITAADEIARANTRAIDCIVVDHHRCPPALPPAFATLNPHQDDCRYPDKVLAAVGVCFNLVIALRKVLRDEGWYRARGMEEPNLRAFLDLVALGTVADMVPLTGVNRVLTTYGVSELKKARRIGIRALMEVSRVRPGRLSSSDLGFRLGPRINAAGRLDDASVGVRLLLSEDLDEARNLAASLDAANSARRQIDGDVFRSAALQVEQMDALPEAIVLADPSWHPGVVGIVASKLVERYDRPAVLIGQGGRGSARTARGIHLYNALNEVSGYLTKFGGHRAAAGLRISSDQIAPFREALIQRVAAQRATGETSISELVYDDEIRPEEIDNACWEELNRLQPFGAGNPEPLFRLPNVRVRATRIVGREHLKLRLFEGAHGGLKAIAFKRADLEPALVPGRSIELAVHLEQNEFAGLESLELRVRDVKTLEA